MLLHTLLLLSVFTIVFSIGNRDIKFEVYWNIPTFMCHKYGIFFNISQYGISQNKDDEFKGEKMLILYDPGEFPAFLSDELVDEDEDETVNGKQGNVVARNGGLPQLGDLNLHLKAMRQLIEEQVPDKNFAGK
jgi:hyaluronoglucosaminidase